MNSKLLVLFKILTLVYLRQCFCAAAVVQPNKESAKTCNEYFGYPNTVCAPECLLNQNCTENKACINQKCLDPCPGACGINGLCHVMNHQPICNCPPQYTGNPFVECILNETKIIQPSEESVNVCNPSPCGANAECKQENGTASCICLPERFGNPYTGCKPECLLNENCPQNKACINQKCQDPCPDVCGKNGLCHVENHLPICNCPPHYIGNPFVECFLNETEKNPCIPSPCGAYGQCKNINGKPSCSCLIGCTPECSVNADCADNLVCLKYKCTEPCPGLCGLNSECVVVSHIPVCSCKSGYTGNPYNVCHAI